MLEKKLKPKKKSKNLELRAQICYCVWARYYKNLASKFLLWEKDTVTFRLVSAILRSETEIASTYVEITSSSSCYNNILFKK